MEETGVQKLARVLKALLTLILIGNLAVIPLIPGLVGLRDCRDLSMLNLFHFLAACWQYLWRIWRDQYAGVLSVFLMFCAACSAVVLWQARSVLGSIVDQNTFTLANARSMKRSAICSFLISLAAALRTIWGFFYYRSLAPIFTYNALFVPAFLMGGLLCLVMSALFRQAAELKAENDLTI